MLTFKRTTGGYEVLIDNKQFGWINKERGFFTDPTVVKEFLQVSSAQLREIADKAEFEQISKKYTNLAVWWIPSTDDNRLQESDDEIAKLPRYIAREARSRMGRPGHGRLWISPDIQPRIDRIEWDNSKPCAHRAEQSGGIIIYKNHIDALSRLPGFVTDLQLNLIRELS